MDEGESVSMDQSEKQRALSTEVERSERELEDLERNLQLIEAEIDGLGEERPQYELLAEICRSLDELDDLGATRLFWSDDEGEESRKTRVSFARGQLDLYVEAIEDAEDRRRVIINKIGDRNRQLDYLHYDLQALLEEEDTRKNEWVPEREEDEPQARVQIMPWSRGSEEDRRANRSVVTSLAASIAFAVLLSMIAIPVLDEPEEIELPERVARLVRQERLPPPPPPVAEPEIPDELPEPEPELVEEASPETIPEVTEEPVLAEAAQPDTREQVKSKGLLAFRDSFASQAERRPSAQLGSQARLSSAGEDSVGRPERMMVTTSAPGSSGGINLGDYSRDFGGGGGGGMDGVAVSRVASAIGGGGGPDRPLAGGASAGRTDEEIQIVFDRYKAALYRMYNRELRKDPTLRGQLVLQLTIEPDGSVSLCKLYSSSMDAPLLADQVVDRVRTFDFGAKENIVAVTIIYPIDFLPAA